MFENEIATMVPIIKETILKLLGAIGSEKEINKYIEKFSSPEQRFAVIKVGGSVIQNDLDNLIASLIFLFKLTSFVNKKFFATCWVIVDAPSSLLDAITLEILLIIALNTPFASTPGCE